MRTITLRVGDKLQVLHDRPFCADLYRGDIVTITGFHERILYDATREFTPVVQDNCLNSWYTSQKTLFKYFRKVRNK